MAGRYIPPPAPVHEPVHGLSPANPCNRRWGGWDSNPRLTDYENSGPMQHALYKHK